MYTMLTGMIKMYVKKGLKLLMYFVIFVVVMAFLIYMFAFTSRDRRILLQSYRSVDINGTSREYLIDIPTNTPKSLVIGLHGFGDNPRQFAYYTALHNSVANDTIVIYPSAISPKQKGIKTGWNSGFCCGSGWINDVDDVGFLGRLIADISTQYGIESKDIFLAGFSNGAFMAQRFATEKPMMIGGIVAVSGTIGTTKKSLQPTVPVPILLINGEKDKTVLFGGGATATDPQFDWLPFSTTEQVWLDANKDKATTKVITYENAGHAWNGWRIVNFWHKRSIASNEAATFIEELR
jgi:poly(3-hydroxybutyrate) depolymerase